jgi:diphosphoinositol-polyphosphate diphosphatase
VPKGGVEKGETSGQAAVREAWEEGAQVCRFFLEILLTWVQAGSPRDLPVPTDDDLLISLTLEPVKKNKSVEVWHVHALKVSERPVDDIREW